MYNNFKYVEKEKCNQISKLVFIYFFFYWGTFVFYITSKNYWWIGLIIFIATFIIVFLTIYLVLIFKKRHRISGRGSVFIESRYGNILNIKKDKREKSKPVVVIPVNSSFDTIIEDSPSIVDRIVEGTSIHGQWLRQYASTPELLEKLDRDISRFISNKHWTPIKTLDNKRGKKDVYSLGSYVFIETDDCTFLLFALTEFDEHNKVIKKDAEEFVNLMRKLMERTRRYLKVLLEGGINDFRK